MGEGTKQIPEIAGLPERASNDDFAAFYQGVDHGELRVQQCVNCGAIQHPPTPMCSECNGFDFLQRQCSLGGRLYSYTIVHHPPLYGFPTPHIVALAEMDDGFRLVAALKNVDDLIVEIGMPLALQFVTSADGVDSYQFVPA